MARNEAVGKAIYSTEVDSSGLKKGLGDAEKTIKRTGAETEKAFAQQGTGAMSKFGKGVDGIVAKFNRIAQGGGIGGAILGGIGLGAGLSAFNMVSGAISGVMENVGKSIELASDKAEAASKANVLFGDSYATIEKASRTAATAVGLSSGAYIAAAGDVGNLLKNMGIAGEAAAGMSKNMLQLAADVGSFNNADPTEVVDAMGAAFRGETEPIRRFGVMLSAAKIEAKALEMGLKDGKKPLSDYGKAMATYQLILEQTAAAQGDFARTADGKANADRIRAAKAEEAWTRLGEVLTPIYQKVMPLIAEATTTAIDTITNLANVAAPLVEGALQAIASAIDLIGDSFTALRELMDPTGTEADKVTRTILEQAKALGIDGDAVVAYTEKLKAQAKAERDRIAIAEQVADLDSTIAKITANATKEIDSYRQAIKDGGDAEALNNIIMERKLQLNTQLQPYLTERDRLLGIQREAQEAVNEVDAEGVRITGLATEALAAYTKHQEELKRSQEAAYILYGRTTEAVVTQSGAFTDAAYRLRGSGGYGSVLLATVEAQDQAAKKLGPSNPEGVAAAVQHTITRTLKTMADAKDPWRQAWRELAEWAKNPFKPKDFEQWLGKQADKAIDKAEQAAKDGKPKVAKRWRELAAAMRNPVVQALVEVGLSVDEAIAAMATVEAAGKRLGNILPSILSVFGRDTAGNNANGTPSWRGGWTWVGERGPELMRLPQGTEIKSNPESMRMAQSSVSGTIEVIVRDPDGGLARAGVVAKDFASSIAELMSSAERTAGLRYSTARR